MIPVETNSGTSCGQHKNQIENLKRENQLEQKDGGPEKAPAAEV
jgi:hypothetical protein